MSPPRGRASVAAASEDRRFRRTQVRPARRKARDRRAWWSVIRGVVAVMLVAGAAIAAWQAVLASPRFKVQEISIRGNQRLATGEIQALLGDFRDEHLLRVDLEGWRQRLLGSPWVASARLRRVFPSEIEITLVERVPLATARINGQLVLVDQSGVAIDEFGPQYADIDLPIVDGLPGSAAGTPETQARVALVRRLLGALSPRPDLLRRLSQIDVADERDAVVMLDDSGVRVHLGAGAFVERLQSYLELAPTLRSRVPEIDYVDLRYEPRVFVRPLAAGDGARPTRPNGSMP